MNSRLVFACNNIITARLDAVPGVRHTSNSVRYADNAESDNVGGRRVDSNRLYGSTDCKVNRHSIDLFIVCAVRAASSNARPGGGVPKLKIGGSRSHGQRSDHFSASERDANDV